MTDPFMRRRNLKAEIARRHDEDLHVDQPYAMSAAFHPPDQVNGGRRMSHRLASF
jgi:hypothetical protein